MKVEVKGLTKIYSYGRAVFENLSFSLSDGEIMSVYGAEGSGKTTLLKCLAGAEKCEGEVLFDGNPLAKKPDDVMMIFSDGALFDNWTVFDNLAFPLKIRKTDKAEIAKRTLRAANAFCLNSVLYQKVKRLTVEERKMTSLARMLVRDFEVVLIDDILKGLPYETRKTLFFELSDFLKGSKKTVIYSTSDRYEALSIADKVLFATPYEIKQISSPEELYFKPQSYWALEAADEFAFSVKAKLTESFGKLYLEYLGFKQDVTPLKERLVTKKYIGCDVLIGMHGTDVVLSDDGIECETVSSSFVSGAYFTKYSNGICRYGSKADKAEKVLLPPDKIMLFDSSSESGILKD